MPDLGHDEKRTRVICVLGPHRSGTSATTRVLNLLGANLGDRLMPPMPENERGFWEHLEVVHVHEELLVALGSSWDDPGPLREHWWLTPEAVAAQHRLLAIIHRDFSGQPLWALKDPRMCRLLPLWHMIFKQVGAQPHYVIVARHPDEVAASLFGRNRMQASQSHALYAEHLLAAEEGTRGAPRAFATYDALLDDWRACISSIGQALDVCWPNPVDRAGADIDAFLEPALKHHVHAPLADVFADGWAMDCYRAVQSRDPVAWDAIWSRYRLASSHFRSILEHHRQPPEAAREADETAARNRLNEEIGALRTELSDVRANQATLSATCDQLLAAAQSETIARARLEAANATTAAERTRLNEEVGGVRTELLATRAELSDVHAELSGVRMELSDVRASQAAISAACDQLLAAARSDAAAREQLETSIAAAAAERVRILERINALAAERLALLDAHQASVREADANRAVLLAKDQALSELNGSLAEFEADRARRVAHVLELEIAVGDREQQIKRLESSVSWRVTGPFRATASGLRALSPAVMKHRARQVFHRLPISQDTKRALVRTYRGISGRHPAQARILKEEEFLQQNGQPGVPSSAALTGGIAALDIVSVRDGDVATVASKLRFTASSAPVVSIVIPVFNNLRFTIECLAALCRHRPKVDCEIIIVDDSSSDATPRVVGSIEGVTLVRNDENLGFIRSCNLGARRARGQYVVLLNNDTQVQAGWLDSLVDVFETHPDAGLAGAKLVYPSGHLQEAGAVVLRDGRADLVGLNDDPTKSVYNMLRRVDYCSGACIMLPRELFIDLGGLDEHFLPAYCEDADLAFRVRGGGRHVYYQPASVVVHHLSVTTASTPESKIPLVAHNQARFIARWQAELEQLNTVRLIAFYLPQYHPIPENDAWWGKGFTEWSNVSRARPNFAGHYQPRLPADLGYYDLRVPDVREAQAALAKQYGVDAFCYYYYWFSGAKLLQRPIEEVVASGAPDHGFCLCWANENWTRRWDGQESSILMRQGYGPHDAVRFMDDVSPILADRRYVRVDGRPLLLVYNVSELPDPRQWTETWRATARQNGLGDLYLVYVKSVFGNRMVSVRPADLGFDAAVEFPPNEMAVPGAAPGAMLNPAFRGRMFDYAATAKAFINRSLPDLSIFRGVMPGWDNTARRQDDSHIFVSSPDVYETWLREMVAYTRRFRFGDERIVFINAWNEWAEGNHLEPDKIFGHQFLEATRRARDLYAPPAPAERALLEAAMADGGRA